MNNTSEASAPILQIENLEWMYILVDNSSFGNNFGTITNDIFLKGIHRLDFVNSYWFQQPEPFELPVNPKRNKAKFVI